MAGLTWRLCVTCIAAVISLATAGTHWGYTGSHGKEHWGKDHPICSKGQSQSPIHIQTSDTQFGEHFWDFELSDLSKEKKEYSLTNNGHSVTVTMDNIYMLIGASLPDVYRVAQFHFHWGSDDSQGSEHKLNGEAYPLEMHIVCYDAEKYDTIGDAANKPSGLAVIGVFFKVGQSDNVHLKPIIDGLERVNEPGTTSIKPVHLEMLLPRRTRYYYRYNGSLTTPGCMESVVWTVLDMPQTLSAFQLQQFRALTLGDSVPMVDNYRDPQPLHGRVVKRSFPHRIEYVIIDDVEGIVDTPTHASGATPTRQGAALVTAVVATAFALLR